MNLKQAIDQAGGPTEVAKRIGVSPQRLANWIARGVPASYCLRLESLTGISRKDLRPDDWADYWPEPATAEVQ